MRSWRTIKIILVILFYCTTKLTTSDNTIYIVCDEVTSFTRLSTFISVTGTFTAFVSANCPLTAPCRLFRITSFFTTLSLYPLSTHCFITTACSFCITNTITTRISAHCFIATAGIIAVTGVTANLCIRWSANDLALRATFVIQSSSCCLSLSVHTISVKDFIRNFLFQITRSQTIK